MSSNLIYTRKTDRTPYFYIIQHIPSGKLYAGCRYAKGCHPSEFMQPGGYCTSSKKINKLIISDGLESFKIIRIMTESECGICVHNYETIFLSTHDISNRKNWLNGHNNSLYPYQSKELKAKMIELYGVEHGMQSKEILETAMNTCLSKYGKPALQIARETEFTCPHCGVIGYGSNMIKWHFDNCKQKPENLEIIKQKEAERIAEMTCPHCGKVCLGYKGASTGHFDKCKFNPDIIKRREEEYLTDITCPHCGFLCKERNSKRSHFARCAHHPDRLAKIEKRKEERRLSSICPHCQTECKGPNIFRIHFDYCKQNPNRIIKDKRNLKNRI